MIDQDEPETQDGPDESCQVAVEPNEPGGARTDAQAGLPAHAVGFDPSRPVATSAPPPELQTGVPDLPLLNDREREAQAEAAAASTGGGGTDATEPENVVEPENIA